MTALSQPLSSVMWGPSEFQLVFGSAPVGVAVVNADGVIEYANPYLAHLLGVPGEEIVGSSPVRFIHAEDVINDRAQFRDLIAGFLPAYQLEQRYVRSDGAVIWGRLSVSAARRPEGSIYAIGMVEDITEAKRERERQLLQQQLLRDRQAKAQFLSEAGHVLSSSLDYEATLRTVARLAVPRVADWCTIHMVDDAGVVTRLEVAHANPAMLEVALEYERKFPPNPTDRDSALHRVVRTGRAELYSEITREMMERAELPRDQVQALEDLQLHAAMIVPLIGNGRALGAITFVSAETRRTYDAADLWLAQALATRAALAVENAKLLLRAESANRAKSAFLATMSHEIRTPINAIIGYTDLLDAGIAGPLTNQQQNYLHRIVESSGHLLRLINDVLDLSRIEAGGMSVVRARVSATAVVTEAVGLVRPEVSRRGIILEETCLCGPPPILLGDGGRVRQILVNLLSNAIKFTAKDGLISVVCGMDVPSPECGLPKERHVFIRVIDTGAGIPTDQLEAIFQPFVQVDTALTRTHGGSGLGLAISRQLAHLMKGQIMVTSELGLGSCFTVWLPTVEQTPSAA